ncbi:unnamed protein product [Rotaria sp. Silwood2]|nr:unnamed protein product [Rotaria sp. Silwood2]
MERILLAVDYPNLTELKLFNFKREIVLSYFTNESSLRHIFQQQITNLILINNDKKKMIGSLRNYTINVYGHILKFFKNLTHLSIIEGFNSSYPGLILDDLPSTTFFSSTLTHLCINTYNLDDCLYLLDGRLKQLTTLIVRIQYIHFSSIVHNMDNLPKLKCFSLKCYVQICQYDETILPLLRRMSYLENLTLYLRIKNRDTFIDKIHLENEIHVYMPQLHLFTFYICTYDNTVDLFRYVPSQDIQRNATYVGHQRMATIINYINSYIDCTAVCSIFSLPFAFDRLESIGNIFPDIVFKYVTYLLVQDVVPFNHEFFVRVSRAFPLLNNLRVINTKSQSASNVNAFSSDYTQSYSIAEYPYLTSLNVRTACIDYLEQFLNETKTYVPCLTELTTYYQSLRIVTKNFRREETRRNYIIKFQLFELNEPESIDITHLSVGKTAHSAINRLQNLLPTRVLCNCPRTTNLDTLPSNETASYTSMISPTASSATTNEGDDESGWTNFDIDFNESILQVHKRSPLYIVGDRAQYRVRNFFEVNTWVLKSFQTGRLEQFQNYCFLLLEFHDVSQI